MDRKRAFLLLHQALFRAGEFLVFFDIQLPLIGDFIFHEDRVHRTLRLAEAAVNALIGVNIKLIVGFVDAIHGQTATQDLSLTPMQGSVIT